MEENILVLEVSKADAEHLKRMPFLETSIRIGADESEFFNLLFETMETDKIKAYFKDGSLSIAVPKDLYSNWISSNDHCLEEIQAAGMKEELKITIEKRF